MARPQKEGLDYFPLDVDIDQDDKLIVPLGKYGVTGFGIIVRLMMAIYKNGYHYRWGEKEQFTFANRINVDINVVNDVVNECVKWGFFHQHVLESHGVLTSKGFQNRYIEAAKRRKEITMSEDHILADVQKLCNQYKVTIIVVSADGSLINVYKNEDIANVTSTESTQSKVKESKGKESKNRLKKEPLSRDKKEYPDESAPYKMAVYLHQKIMEHAEQSGVGHLVQKSNLQTWADDCRKLLEIDKVDKELIRAVIDWSTSNDFWKKNILSASKLRMKFAQLAIEMHRDKNPDPSGNRNGNPKKKIPKEQQSLTARFAKS